MKTGLVLAVLFFSFTASSQYYYNDVVGVRESAALIAAYQGNKVRTVALKSYTVNNAPIDNLSITQEFIASRLALRTSTQSEYAGASYLTTYVDASGRVVRTTDSTGDVVKTTLYQYNAAGKLTAVLLQTSDSLAATQTDDHLWQYDAQGRIAKMLRIKNKKDSAVVSFKLDEKGAVVEEQEKRGYLTEEPWYYYYDASSRLTDIVRYNKKAHRLLPETMFEYSGNGQTLQRITVPQNSDDYLIWRYAYDAKGLKTKEVIYNKQKEQTGKVEYVYTFEK